MASTADRCGAISPRAKATELDLDRSDLTSYVNDTSGRLRAAAPFSMLASFREMVVAMRSHSSNFAYAKHAHVVDSGRWQPLLMEE